MLVSRWCPGGRITALDLKLLSSPGSTHLSPPGNKRMCSFLHTGTLDAPALLHREVQKYQQPNTIRLGSKVFRKENEVIIYDIHDCVECKPGPIVKSAKQ